MGHEDRRAVHGQDQAEEFGRRNAVPGEVLVRLVPKVVLAQADLAD